MGLRFTKRYRLIPGITVNVSKSTLSLTFGIKHLPQLTVSRRKMQLTIPLNIHNAYYTKVWTRKKKKKKIKTRKYIKKSEVVVPVSHEVSWQKDIDVGIAYIVKYIFSIIKT